jgi:type II secretory pathway predicted ATPase ExeA
MSNQDHFPTNLLNRPHQARWAYFYHKIVAHPRLMAIDQELKQAIQYAPKGRLILLFGPTGVGKTTLRRGVERALIDALLPELEQDRGRIPVASVEAVAPEQGNFDWPDFYQRALLRLHEPLANDKIVYDAALEDGASDRQQKGQVVSQAKANLRTLRQALEKCLRHRRPAAFIIDDAHHLQKIAGPRRLQDQMDAVKSLANRSDAVHVLIGTYELLNLTNLNDQLSRRSYPIAFTRYQPSCEEDVNAFKAVLKTFQHHLPLSKEPNLVQHWDYFYEHSAGCVGILKLWLCDTLAAALEHDQKTLTDSYLQRYAMSPDRLMNIVREIIEGERKQEELEEQRRHIRAALGLALDPVFTEPSKPPRKIGRVGERRPVRDPIGGQPDDD